MSMRDGMALFKDKFRIFSRSDGPYGVRFIAAPYSDDEADSMKVLGHNRDPERLSAQSITALLMKFGITESDFKKAYNGFHAS